MTSEQRLVNQIRELVSHSGIDNAALSEDLAEQFTDLSYAVNERLNKCEEYLKKGMRSEAVHEAQVAPPLLELVATLDFAELQTWRKLCLELEIAPFPELRLDVATRLRDECSTEEMLSPLLKQYRRLVHQGSRSEQIQVLRQIRELDPDNDVWLDNLAPLETEELELIIDATKAALRSENLAELASLYEELTEPRRVVAAPADILEQVQQRLRRERRRQAAGEGERLISAIDAAVDEGKEETVAGLLAKWDRLQQYDDFHPVADMLAIARHARQWLETQQQQRAAEQQYAAALKQLHLVMHAQPLDFAELASAEQALRGLGRGLPPELENDLQMLRTRLAAAAQRQRRNRALAISATVVLLLTMAALTTMFIYRKQERQKRLAHAQQLVEQSAYEQAQTLLTAIKAQDPRFFASEAVQRLQHRVATILQQQQQAQQQFDTAFDRLEELRRRSYDLPRAQTEQLLTAAGELAVTGEQQNRLAEWRLAWQTALIRRQEQADRSYSEALIKLQRALAPRQRESSLEQQIVAIAEIEAQLGQLQQLQRHASDPQAEAVQHLETELATWQQQIAATQQQQRDAEARRHQLLADYPKALPDITAYLQNLRQISELYPHEPEVEAFNRILSQAPLLHDAAALADFQLRQLPTTSAELTTLETRRQRLADSNNSIWHADLSRSIAEATRQQQARTALQNLTRLPWFNYKVFHVKPKDQANWQAVYYPHEILSRDDTTADGKEFTLYWGQVWKTGVDIDEPWLEHSRWDSLEFDINLHRRRDRTIVPTARAVHALLAEMPQAGALEHFVLDAMLRLARDGSCRPLPRAQVVTRMAAIAAELMPEHSHELKAVMQLFAEIDLNMHWINEMNPAVRAVSQDAERQLALVPDLRHLAEQVQANRQLLQAALSRQLRPIGCCVRAADGSVRPLFTVDGSASRAWVVGIGAGNRRVFIEAVRMTSTGQLVTLPAAESYLMPGQVLFAPSVNVERDLGKAAQTLNPRSVQWPASWPANACDLSSLGAL